jgi:hypothetical protein
LDVWKIWYGCLKNMKMDYTRNNTCAVNPKVNQLLQLKISPLLGPEISLLCLEGGGVGGLLNGLAGALRGVHMWGS